MFKNEADATLFLMKELKKVWRFYKIRDVGNFKKPLDIIGVKGWGFVGIEVKHMKNKKKPTREQIEKKLQPHQIVSLKEIERAGWSALVIVSRQDEWITYRYDGEDQPPYLYWNLFSKKTWQILL